MDNKVDFIIELYELFYRDFTGNRKYKFNYNKQNLTLVKKFIDKLNYNHNEDWLFDYFGFQFQVRSTQNINPNFMFGKVKVMLGWIIGPKALSTYLKASDEQKYYGREYIINRKIKNPKQERFIPFENVELKDYYDRERRRFLNTDLGLVHCKDLGLSYDKRSKYCVTCKNKKLCISVEIK